MALLTAPAAAPPARPAQALVALLLRFTLLSVLLLSAPYAPSPPPSVAQCSPNSLFACSPPHHPLLPWFLSRPQPCFSPVDSSTQRLLLPWLRRAPSHFRRLLRIQPYFSPVDSSTHPLLLPWPPRALPHVRRLLPSWPPPYSDHPAARSIERIPPAPARRPRPRHLPLGGAVLVRSRLCPSGPELL